MNGKRLYRCRQDRQLAGVAGGMAEYLEIDPTVVRVLWILSVFLGGFTLLLYVIMAFVVPLEPVGYAGPNSGWPRANPMGPNPAWPNANPASAASAADAAGTTPASAPAEGADGPTGTVGATGGAPLAGTAGWSEQPHWTHGASQPGWTPGPAHHEPRNGSATLVFGVLLVVFGAIALLGPLFPGWLTGAHLGPAFLVALGIALLVVAVRRPAARS